MFSKFRGNFKFTLEHTKAGLTSDERQQPTPLRYRLRSIVLKLANEKLMTDEAERHVRKITIII
jgi:hypothetical protein